jgi:hypothetical protein
VTMGMAAEAMAETVTAEAMVEAANAMEMVCPYNSAATAGWCTRFGLVGTPPESVGTHSRRFSY